MTKHIVQLPNPDGSLLLRELNHRIRNELTSAIHAVSANAVQSDRANRVARLLAFSDDFPPGFSPTKQQKSSTGAPLCRAPEGYGLVAGGAGQLKVTNY
jgi:hypothetical protein